MKRIVYLLIYTVISVNFCFSQKTPITLYELDKKIKNSEKENIEKSPFKSAQSMNARLHFFTYEFRKVYLKEFIYLRNKHPEKEILLVESFSHSCSNCAPSYIQIYNGKDYLFYDVVLENGRSKLKKRMNNEISKYLDADIIEIYENRNQKVNWNSNPEKYGTEICFDGSHSLYHMLYPNKKVVSMYMRCWISKENRKNHE
ncbi:conserved protein of unknown function [Tenacibaculum sp. 190130A14a]|uniref:DUF255 domain-containing protein n=1 Tax=Tenacibaculum polynesiense TaxID=3137857 RepID=A0ABP1F1W8_9FLAO